MNFSGFIDSFGYMAHGLAGIFVVMGTIACAISLLNKIFNK